MDCPAWTELTRYHGVADRKSDHLAAADDPRPRARVSGRVVQHREMGKLVFFVLRDHSDDLQVSVSKKSNPPID